MATPSEPEFPRASSPLRLLASGREEYDAAQTGMALRDWFAGQALAGLLPYYADVAYGADGVSDEAYDLADAMLRRRRL